MHIPVSAFNCATTLMALPDMEFLLILRSKNGSATMGNMDLTVGRDILREKSNESVLREPAVPVTHSFLDQDQVLPEGGRQEEEVGDELRPEQLSGGVEGSPNLHQSLQEVRVGGKTWGQPEGEGVEPGQDSLQLAGPGRQKRKAPIMEDDSEDDFVGSSPKQPHAKGNLTLWQPLPDLDTEYSKLKQAAKKTFANRLLKCVKPPGVRLGGKVRSKRLYSLVLIN